MGAEQSSTNEVHAFRPPTDSDDSEAGQRASAKWKRRLSAVIGVGGGVAAGERKIGRPVSSRAGSADSRLAVVAARERQRTAGTKEAGGDNDTAAQRPAARQYSYSAAVPRGRRTSVVTAANDDADGGHTGNSNTLSPHSCTHKEDASQESTPAHSDEETRRCGSGRSRTAAVGKSALPPLCTQTSNESAASARRMRRRINFTRGTPVLPVHCGTACQPRGPCGANERPASAKRPGGRWRMTKSQSGSLDSGLHKAVAPVHQPQPEEVRRECRSNARQRAISETSSNGSGYDTDEGDGSAVAGRSACNNADDLQLSDLE